MDGRTFKTKMTVTSTSVKATGTNKNGKPYTISLVEATDADGKPVTEILKSWDNCPVGQLVEYEVTEEVHEKYGTSYWLRPPKGVRGSGGGNTNGAAVDALRLRVEALEVAVRKLMEGATVVGGGSPAMSPPPAPTEQLPLGGGFPPPVPESAVEGFGSDSDVLF